MQIINVAICTWATLFTWLALTLPNETKQFYFINNVNNVTVPTSPPPTKKKRLLLPYPWDLTVMFTLKNFKSSITKDTPIHVFLFIRIFLYILN